MKRTGGREWYTRTRVPCDARRPSIRRVVVETRCKDHKTRMFISAVHRRYAGWWCAHGAHVAEMYVAYNIASCRCNRLPPPPTFPRLRFHFAPRTLPDRPRHSSAMPTEFIRWGALDTDLNLASCFSRNLAARGVEGNADRIVEMADHG